ncbi:TIGR04255 family protein [Frigidibacter sp. ROC022]|uniref:TIGR04255 family protein n=1 Tax=Frigidibacter sp. ROC022 TaxID=2971796 RepID=UPI00215A625A|nr:TIGR04255 family protein [Frigidibacter sp. ROC022]MCR8724250.1 TIGR04255 family protein [Frigidibacter sp. ROC022]
MKKQVDFESPPVIEVVLGVSFSRLEKFMIPHFGGYWKSLSGEFTKIEDQPPIVGENRDFAETTIPSRVWFSNDAGTRLIQLQQDRFIFNWRRQDGDPNEYPEFSKIFPEFVAAFSHFQDFLSKEKIAEDVAVEGLELTYVNIIKFDSIHCCVQRPGDAFVDHRRDVSRERFLPEVQDFSWVSVYEMPKQMGKLSVDAKSAKLSVSPKARVIRLLLTAKGAPASFDDDGFQMWFDCAHDQIVNGFADITDESVQRRVWGKR